MYAPKDPTTVTTLDELQDFVREELDQIAQEFGSTDLVWLNPRHVEPDKPREGMVAYADGSDWNPGGGEGIYEFDGSNWVRPGPYPNPNIVTPYQFGAVGDGVADDTAAVQSAVATGLDVDLRGGKYLVKSQIVMQARQTMYHGQLLHGFNGDFIDMTNEQSSLDHVIVEANGFTGRGIIVGGGSASLHRGRLRRVHVGYFNAWAGYALEFFNPDGGALFSCWDCTFGSSQPYGVKLPIDTLGVFTGRFFIDCNNGGSPLIDLNGGRGTRIIGGGSTGIAFSNAACAYTTIMHNRLAAGVVVNGGGHTIAYCDVGGTLTINGNDQVIGPNVHSGNSLVLNNGTTNSVIYVSDSTFTDSNSPAQASNKIYGNSKPTAPTWGSNGVAPTLGNGTIQGQVSTEGTLRKFSGRLKLGSTSTIGTGAYTFTWAAPWNFDPPFNATGTASFSDASTSNIYRGIAVMFAGLPGQVFIEVGDGTANFFGATAPVVPASGDEIDFELSFHHNGG
jgi:hypothetical protein